MSSMKQHISALAICVVLTACTSLGREARLQISELTKIIKQATNDNARAEAYIKRGYVYPIRYSLKILADYTQAIALAANNDTRALAYKRRAMMHSLNRQPKKAIADYTQAIALFSDDDEKANVHERRADIYSDAKQYTKAEHDFTQAVALYSDDNEKSFVYARRAEMYTFEQQYGKAIEDYLKAAGLFSGSFFELTEEEVRAWMYDQIGSLCHEQYGNAIDYCTKAIDLGPEFSKRRGQMYEELGEDKKARAQKRSHP